MAFERLGRICLVGCGNMGGAMLRRWIEAGLAPSDVTVVDPAAPACPTGVRLVETLDRLEDIDTLVLAIKPQQFGALVASGSLARVAPRLTISILAGVEMATLKNGVATGTVVRAMPNLPVSIGKGVVALFAADRWDDAAAYAAAALMQPLGSVEWIEEEAQFDAATALAGCGPGFVFRFADALTVAGSALGLDETLARRLALATLEGSAIMAATADAPPAELADRVASPGGSTRQGLNVLDHEDALQRLMIATVAAAAERNREMAIIARSDAG